MTDPSTHVRRATGQAVVRRVPKYSVFMIAGGILGVVVAGILAFAFDGTVGRYGEDIPSQYSAVVYSKAQILGFLALICVPVGVALGGTIALILGRSAQRHEYVVQVEHEVVTEQAPAPVSTDLPQAPESADAASQSERETDPSDG